MLEALLGNSYFALFLIVALGFILGSIKIKGISLDVSAVIFIALLFGHFGVVIPKDLGNFGLVLFIFTIGIQAGPGFFDSFKSKGKILIIITSLIISSAALTGIVLSLIYGISSSELTGLMAGALTSTPGLAAAIDATKSSSASIAYGIAYPFGVIGVILFVKLFPRICRIDLKKEEERLSSLESKKNPEVLSLVFEVTNDLIVGKALHQLEVRTLTGAVISRIRKNGEVIVPNAETIVEKGDIIRAVGTSESLEQIEELFGPRVEVDIPLSKNYTVEKFLVTSKNVVGKKISELNIQTHLGCTITRVRRSGITLEAKKDLELKFGDKITVVGVAESMPNFAKLVGNDEKRISDTDFLPIALGIVLGVIFGKINISFSDSFSFSPGLTGGVLIVALILSAIGKTGPIIWTMSGSSNNLLRQLGLLLFLAEVGTSAGVNLVSTFQESGFLLFAVGFAITLVPMLVAGIVGYYVFKISIFDLLGTITGGMTSTPGLAAADTASRKFSPSVAYATVYPIAMVLLIVFIQIIATFFPV